MLRDIFKNELGEYNPKAEKVGIKGFICFIVRFMLSLILPVLLVYLEAWELTLDLETLIWDIDFKIRFLYFMIFIGANLSMQLVALLTTYRINGNPQRLKCKKFFRKFALALYIVAVIFYITANIIY